MRASTCLALLAALVLSGCATNGQTALDPGSPGSPTYPGGVQHTDQTSVSNQPDSFTLSGNAAHKTGSDPYAWQVSKTSAQVVYSVSVAGGQLNLTLTDQLGRVVYQHTLRAGEQAQGTQATQVGIPGSWNVRLDWSDFTGSISLQVSAQ